MARRLAPQSKLAKKAAMATLVFTPELLERARGGVDSLSPLLSQWAAPGEKEETVREQIERAAALVPKRRDGDHVKIAGGGATTGKYLRETLERLRLDRPGTRLVRVHTHAFALAMGAQRRHHRKAQGDFGALFCCRD